MNHQFGYLLSLVYDRSGGAMSMAPKVLEESGLIYWFHSHDALNEDRTSVHVGKGSQDDYNDAKVWLEPTIQVARAGRTLRDYELRRSLKVIEQNWEYLLEEWYDYRHRSRR